MRESVEANPAKWQYGTAANAHGIRRRHQTVIGQRIFRTPSFDRRGEPDARRRRLSVLKLGTPISLGAA